MSDERESNFCPSSAVSERLIFSAVYKKERAVGFRAVAVVAFVLWVAKASGQVEPAPEEVYPWPSVGDWTEWTVTTDYIHVDRFWGRRGIQEIFVTPRLTLEPKVLREFRYGLPGRIRLTPSLVIEEAFTDNLFLLPDSEKEADLIHLISPGIRLDMKRLNYSLRLGYSADFWIYSRFSDCNRIDQHATFDLFWTPRTNVHWFVSYIFSAQGTSPRAPREESAYYYDNFFSIGLSIDYTNRLRQDVQVFDEFGIFPDDDFRDAGFNDFAVRTRLSYLLFPKTRVFTEYQFDWVENVVSPTSNVRHRVGAGLSWTPTGKIRGEVSGGYEWILYRGQPQNNGLSILTSVEYAYSPRTVVGISVLQDITQTNVAAQNVNAGQSYQTTSVILGASHNLRPNLALVANAFWSVDNFGFQGDPHTTGGSDRADMLYGFRIGLNWAPTPWLLVGPQYQFQKCESRGEDTSDANNFMENMISLRLTLAF